MKYISFILENEYIKKSILLNENVVGYMVQHLPILADSTINYVKKNKKKFIKEDNINLTRKNIVDFSKQINTDYINYCIEIIRLDINIENKKELISEFILN